MTGFDDDLNACAALVERGDPDRFLATMAVPVAARRVLFPLYAFNIEVARAPWLTKEPLIAEMRLQWWSDALDEIATRGVVRRHEVVTPLAHVLTPEAAGLLHALVAARRRDIERVPFEDEAALAGYLEATAAGLFQAAVLALGGSLSSAAGDIGYASGVVRYLQAVPELEARGRMPLPDGRPEAVAALARTGLERLRRGRAGLAEVPREARAGLVAGWQSGALLRRAARRPGQVPGGGLVLSDGGKRLRLMAETLRLGL